MPILLEIPEQKATNYQKRIASLLDCSKTGDMKLEGHDGLIPSIFFLSKDDEFPWKSFYEKLKIAWFCSTPSEIPLAFQLKRKVTDDILQDFDKITEKDIPKVFAALRKSGYFKPLPQKLKI